MTALALLLHAHLPDVVAPTPGGQEEAWLYEALIDVYLPLCRMLDGFAADGIAAPLTVSVAPPLAGMLRDRRIDGRLENHIDQLLVCNASHARAAPDAYQDAIEGRRRDLEQARHDWRALGGDLLGAWRRHAAAGRIELATTALSHAYLPAIATHPSVHLALARTAVPNIGRGLWMPECAIDRRVRGALEHVEANWTVVASHAQDELATIHGGVVYFRRDATTAREVWSRSSGYPAAPAYRAHHLDASGRWGGARGPRGLGYWAIGRGAPQPYRPAVAQRQAKEDAARFVARRIRERASHAGPRVMPFDAELFGHWWSEGPLFLDHVLRGIAAHDELTAATMSACQEAAHDGPPPRATTWGRGGHGDVWVGARTAWMWREVHRAERAVAAACRRGVATAPDAVRELMLAQASDWAFMLDADRCAGYAKQRFDDHLKGAWEAAQGIARPRDHHSLDSVPDDALVEAMATAGP